MRESHTAKKRGEMFSEAACRKEVSGKAQSTQKERRRRNQHVSWEAREEDGQKQLLIFSSHN